MTLEDWNSLEEDTQIQSSRFNYKLLFKDPVGIWLTEQSNIYSKSSNGFKKLQPKIKDICRFRVVR